MNATFHISYQHVDPSPALDALVRAELERLAREEPRIVSARIGVERAHARGGAPFEVHLTIELPGPDIVIAHRADVHGSSAETDDYVRLRKEPEIDEQFRDASLAVRQAFAKARRKLHERYSS